MATGTKKQVGGNHYLRLTYPVMRPQCHGQGIRAGSNQDVTKTAASLIRERMFVKLKPEYEKIDFIKVAYSDLIGKTLFCEVRNTRSVTQIIFRPGVTRNVPDEWLEDETERVTNILNNYADIIEEPNSIFDALAKERDALEEWIATYIEIDRWPSRTE